MHTHPLIEALVEDLSASHRRFSGQMLVRVGLAAMCAGLIFYGLYGFRDDGLAALGDLRFLAKIGLLAALLWGLWPLMRRAAGPIKVKARDLRPLAFVSLVWVAMVGCEAVLIPPVEWQRVMIGENGTFCLTSIPLIGTPVLVAMLATLRTAAPERAIISGALAGFFSAAVAGLVYAVHCPDDSPFFVVVWYGAATIILILCGALSGRVLLRW